MTTSHQPERQTSLLSEWQGKGRRAWMKTTHDLHDDETQPRKEKLFAFAYFACCIRGAGLAASRRCATVGHAAPYFILSFGRSTSERVIHTARVGKGSTRVHFLGDLLLVGHWIAALEVTFWFLRLLAFCLLRLLLLS
jgi:hypothetical protein